MTTTPNRQPEIIHGTRDGYVNHCRRGDAIRWREGTLERCQPCTDANREAKAEYRATRRLLALRAAAHRTRTSQAAQGQNPTAQEAS